MKESPLIPVKPWYKQFWPWLIIALPASSVIAGLSTLYIAFNTQDTLVRDDWYKEGTTINRRIELDKNALSLGLSATLTVDDINGELLLDLHSTQLNYPYPSQLSMEFIHPTLAQKDQRLTLMLTQNGRYHGNLERSLLGKYQLLLSNKMPDAPEVTTTQTYKDVWRLMQVEFFPLKNTITLGS